MISYKSDRYILLMVCLVFYTGHLAYSVTQSLDRINIKNRINILNNNGKSLKSHTCIYVLLLKLSVVVMAIIVELCKYVVPYFHVPVTVAAYSTARLTASVLLASVIINL